MKAPTTQEEKPQHAKDADPENYGDKFNNNNINRFAWLPKEQDELAQVQTVFLLTKEARVLPPITHREPLSLKEEFDKKIRETNNGSKEIRRQNECIALTNKALFKYHLGNKYSTSIYLVGGEMIPIKKSSNGKCYISTPIVLGESIKTFTYSESGEPMTRLEEMWSVEKIEDCQLDNYHSPQIVKH